VNMTYTAVIAVKNGMDYIDVAVESILNQSLSATKIIVVDDNSEDATYDYITRKHSEIELIKSPYSGQQMAINYALDFVDTEFVAFLDVDDYWEKDKQIVQLRSFQDNSDIDVVCSGTRNFLNSKKDKLDFSQNAREFNESRQFSACTFRTEVLKKRFPLNKEVGHFQWQISWWANAVNQGLRYCQTGKVQLNRRIHSENSWNVENGIGNRQLLEFIRLHRGRK
jgi:glycosyltransferase involved in cell wall biosynthesis